MVWIIVFSLFCGFGSRLGDAIMVSVLSVEVNGICS